MKTFSVVLTYYRRPELLSRALYCLRQQTYQDFEVVPVFDGEDEQALTVYDQFQQKTGDKRFQEVIIFRGMERAHYGNEVRRKALKYCQNDYVVWYGHDCLIDKDYLETHANQIQNHWCVSVVSQSHFTEWDHSRDWLLYREDLPPGKSKESMEMGKIDLLNFAVPRHVAQQYAWLQEYWARYEADWFTFKEILDNTTLQLLVSSKVVCAHF